MSNHYLVALEDGNYGTEQLAIIGQEDYDGTRHFLTDEEDKVQFVYIRKHHEDEENRIVYWQATSKVTRSKLQYDGRDEYFVSRHEKHYLNRMLRINCANPWYYPEDYKDVLL